jgi:hypothetical protein
MSDHDYAGDGRALLATIICGLNALWCVAWLGGAAISLSTCGDNPANEQQCGGEVGLFAWWLVGYLILIPPTFWAASALIHAERETPQDWTVRIGLSAFAVAIGVPIIAITWFLLIM